MVEGLVLKSTGSWYRVRRENGEITECKIKGKFRNDNIKNTNPIAVGDIVSFEVEKDGVGVISKIHDRKNYIVRKSINLSKQAHIIAANIDRAYLITAVRQPRTLPLFIDRFLVSAEAYNIPVTLIINKVDIYGSKDLEILNQWKDIYTSAGYEIIETSVVTGQNIATLKEKLSGNCNVLAGNSGVGKSSLINTIDPLLDLKTATISKHNKKGQHTTTFAEMFELQTGGFVIDTPGLKAFGLLEMEKWEISHYFPEMFAMLKDCQYNNCTHTHEPNCRVVEAVENGEIHISRYENYLSIMEDENEKYRKGY